jgi:hypothetical protein
MLLSAERARGRCSPAAERNGTGGGAGFMLRVFRLERVDLARENVLRASLNTEGVGDSTLTASAAALVASRSSSSSSSSESEKMRSASTEVRRA